MDIRSKMTPAFRDLEGGLFSTVTKADVGDGAGKLIERGVDIMAWADPFFPDPSIPPRVKKAMAEAIAGGEPSHYSMPIGRAELRRAIAAKIARQTGREIDPGRNVIVTPGSDAGLMYALMPFIEAGTEVLTPEPSYPNNFLNPRLLGGESVAVPLFARDNYQLRVEELASRLTDRTRVVLLCHPNNPTTTVFRRETLEELAAFIVRHDLILVCDQAFEDHIYDGIEFVAPATLPGMWERTLTVCSVSKGLGLSGFRIGYIYGDDRVIDALYGGAVNVVGAAATVTSIGATAALTDDDYLSQVYTKLERRRRSAYELFSRVNGVAMSRPESGILSWLDVSRLGSDAEVVAYLLEHANVLVNPGSQYGEHGSGFIRIVSACFADDQRAEEAFARIAAALTRLGREKGITP